MGVDPSSVNVTVNGSQGQSSAASQNSVVPAVTTPAPAYPAAPPQTASKTQAPTATDPDDAYWASQPAAVQQLRNMTDQTQRAGLARQLASEGYTIDYPIMVEGWDPEITMQLRQQFGYTWVPSALQSPVPVVPGVNFPGLPSYNPNDPPPGSIPVQTSWA